MTTWHAPEGVTVYRNPTVTKDYIWFTVGVLFVDVHEPEISTLWVQFLIENNIKLDTPFNPGLWKAAITLIHCYTINFDIKKDASRNIWSTTWYLHPIYRRKCLASFKEMPADARWRAFKHVLNVLSLNKE